VQTAKLRNILSAKFCQERLLQTVADPDIQLGGPILCFLVSDVYFFVGGRPKSIAKLDEGPWSDEPLLDPPLSEEAVLCTFPVERQPHLIAGIAGK